MPSWLPAVPRPDAQLTSPPASSPLAISRARQAVRSPAIRRGLRWAGRLLPLLVLGLGTTIAALTHRSPTLPDDALYRALAMSLATAHGYVDSAWLPFTVRPPGYPELLSPLFKVAGPGTQLPWFAQAGLAGVTLALAFALFRQWAGFVPAAGAAAAAILVAGIAEVGTSLRVDLPASSLVLVGAGLANDGLIRERRWPLVAAGVALGGAVLMKETMVVYVLLPVCLWAAVQPRRTALGSAALATFVAASVAWGWWLWVAFVGGGLYPTDLAGPLAIALVAIALPMLLAIAAIARRRLGTWSDTPTGDASNRARGAVLVGAAIPLIAGCLAVLWLGGGAQQDVVGDIVGGIRRFARDRVLPEAGWLLPVLALGTLSAWAAWRNGSRGLRVLILLVALSAPIWFLTAEGARSLRSVALPMLSLVALGAWSIERLVRTALARRGVAPAARLGMLTTAAAVVAASIGLALLPLRAGPAEAAQSWSARPVQDAAHFLDLSLPRRSTIVTGWLYANELYVRTSAAYRMPLIPTLLFRTTGGELLPVSTLYRFTRMTDEEKQQRIGDLVWLRVVPSLRGYMGLSLPGFVDDLRAVQADAIVLTGDSFQSTLDTAPEIDSLDGIDLIASFGGAQDGLRIFSVATAELSAPESWPLLMNGPTLRQLVTDLSAAGVERDALGSAIGAARIQLVEPATQGDHALLDSLVPG